MPLPAAGVDKSLQERLDSLYGEDRRREGERVDIGFKSEGGREVREGREGKEGKEGRARTQEWRRRVRGDKELEKAAREGTLEVDLDVVRQQWVESGQVYDEISEAAELYGVYEDLFPGAYFRPATLLGVEWLQADGVTAVPVHRGNLVAPSECSSPPEVSWPASSSSLWTLAMVAPDSSLTSPDSEVLLWLVANIEGSDISTGETAAQYLRPHPPHGTGYHRVVFVLYRQDRRVDISHERRLEQFNLAEREFSSLEFYRRLQEDLTPAGLAFCQTDYEASLREFFHNELQMREPRYEYEFPEPYVKPWRSFYVDQVDAGFNEFLDRHRDPKDIERQVLESKLANTSPFTGDRTAELHFPGLHDSDLMEQFPPPVGEKRLNPKQSFRTPQWRRNAAMRERQKEGYFATYDHSHLRKDPASCS